MVVASFLDLPERTGKPREAGLTHVFDDGIPVGLAGLLGVVVTVIIGLAVFRLVRHRADREENVTA